MKKFLLLTLAAMPSFMSAQQPVRAGLGSYAAYPPPYKAATADHSGFQASKIETMEIFLDEKPGRPIPTNDWWTDLLHSRFSGAMWSYPAMIHTSSDGVTVDYPSYWYENGTEVKSRSRILVGGRGFTADAAIAADWHDWDVIMRLPDKSGNEMKVTMVHGSPFTWFEFSPDFNPSLSFSETPVFFTADGSTSPLPPESASEIGIRLGDDLYGLWLPAGCSLSMVEGTMSIDRQRVASGYAVVGLLSSADDLEAFTPYARSVPRSTEVSWSYDESRSLINTLWKVNAVGLDGGEAPVMQGFLPHVWKHAVNSSFSYDGPEYLTPRGGMKTAASADGSFAYAYRFSGMLPYFPAPRQRASDSDEAVGYSDTVMQDLIDSYAAGGTFGADTYWGGKGLVQMALNMTFAKETGNAAAYETSRRKLREALVDWLTYTPGEDRYFFARYPRWGAMVGFDVSYDSDAFNDHHFHYGYFTYAAALLCIEDRDFASDYGEMLTLIAKDYANYDRDDNRFPFLRTLDPWSGHSWAGGLGDHGNDNGNGQESSSEAMQSWGGLYMLGVALGDNAMRDAGIFGWMTESNGTAEYWFDRDQLSSDPARPANYDHSLYQHPYNTNITSKGIGWWTWFSGDPLWMHSIQWMPVSPCLNYLSQDLAFARWDFDTMMSTTAYKWFDKVGDNDPLANQSVGNVVLCYMERAYPEEAARIFREAYDRGFPMARGIDTGHISYFTIQSHLTYGDIDFDIYADCPTATAYRRADGSQTFVVYNPGAERDVTFRDASGAVVRTVRVPSGGFSVIDEAPRPDKVSVISSEGLYILPGKSSRLSAALLDQYGATLDGHSFSWALSAAAPATVADGMLSVGSEAALGSEFTVTAVADNGMKADMIIRVDRAPVLSGTITGVPAYVETGTPVVAGIDTAFDGDVTWSVTFDGDEIAASSRFTPSRAGRYTVTATGGGASVTASMTVTPPLPDLARGCAAVSSSEENAGSVTVNAVDGDSSTRWGSAHTEDEWIYVDLGSDCYVTRVDINWEAAFAADYEIRVAPDGASMTRHDGNYFSGPATVSVPAESAWTDVVGVSGVTGAGVRSTVVGATGRYVMMKGLRRGSAYGYSLYSFEVHGIPAGASLSDVIGIDITAPEVMDEGATAELSARAVTLAGDMRPLSGVEWKCSIDADFDGDRFTPRAYGRATLTAISPDGHSSSVGILVNEIEKLASIEVTPSRWEMIAGDEAVVTAKGLNQYGGAYPLNPSTVDIRVTDADGDPVSPDVASYDSATGVFKAAASGVYMIRFGSTGSSTITVRNVSEANLALGKPATATSRNGDNSASLATDGDPSTRWESEHGKDGESITVDLQSAYLVNRVRVLWEGAYAAAYTVMTSVDGVSWSTAAVVAVGKGGAEETSFAEVPARYVRLVGDRRFMTAYGISLYELEVYGRDRFVLDESDARAPELTATAVADNEVLDVTASAVDASGYIFYDIVLMAGNTLVDRQSLSAPSAQTVSARFTGLTHLTVYTVTVTARDPMGNSSTFTDSFTADIDITGKNLALGRPVTESTHKDNNVASNVTDGAFDNRWESQHGSDGEWIEVELDNIYEIHSIGLYSHDGAVAATFDIEISTDGVTYEKLVSDRQWGDDRFVKNGATLYGVEMEFVPRSRAAAGVSQAKYIRYVTKTRKMPQYGTSLSEMEVYGAYGDRFTTSVSPVVDNDIAPVYYNLQGVKVASPKAGSVYIVVRGDSAVKELYR